ncbi:MAG: geranylgeranyl diphosphate synthase type II [Rhodothermales bacterium]|jgi:geranylgeranyl diphosphate synthase type II
MATAIKMPRAIPVRPARKPQDDVPQNKPMRDRLRKLAHWYVAEHKLVPPVPFEDLKVHSQGMVKGTDLEPYANFGAVLLNNASWRDVLARIPYERRLLLMPVCLRVEDGCPAPFDEFGLLCKECGLCSVHDFKREAERLGYALLIAEGTPIVRQLIETGKIEAIVGVSCLNVLERIFPYMEMAAIPGIAIPLLQDDCKDTNVDIDWLWDVLHLSDEDRTYRMDLDGLRREVDSWFTLESLLELMGDVGEETGTMARDWLARSGKRWRPFLAVCAFQALQDSPDTPLTDDLKRIAIAVECFHKASLIHDDIEDADDVRYGEPTVHAEHGIPVALNLGDYLLGEGYRLLAESATDSDKRARMLHAAAIGHRTLSVGQGTELLWTQNPKTIRSREVLRIFSQKTAPAFDVALRIGSIYGGAPEGDQLFDVIATYSEALGIAYQIRDDLDDVFGSADSNDSQDMRPSVVLSIAWEKAKGEDKKRLAALWERREDWSSDPEGFRALVDNSGAEERSKTLLGAYQEEAVRALQPLDNPTVKGLLRRVIGKIFHDNVVLTFCNKESGTTTAIAETVKS